MTRKVLAVVMDGVGYKEDSYGNAVNVAQTPQLNWLKNNALYRKLYAHGTHVGLPSDSDLGNSEVGHNALGAGRIFDQGAKLVQNAIDSKSMFAGNIWQKAISNVKDNNLTLHLPTLSDECTFSRGHLYAMMRKLKAQEFVILVYIYCLMVEMVQRVLKNTLNT